MANRIFDLALTDVGKQVFFGQGIDKRTSLPAKPDGGHCQLERKNTGVGKIRAG